MTINVDDRVKILEGKIAEILNKRGDEKINHDAMIALMTKKILSIENKLLNENIQRKLPQAVLAAQIKQDDANQNTPKLK